MTVKPVIREHRALHELTLGDRALIQIERSCYWTTLAASRVD